MRTLFGLTISLSLLASAVPSAYAVSYPLIEAIRGDRKVTVVSAKGPREAIEGTSVAVGDRVQTSDQVTARVLYEDGSQVLIGRSSEYEVQDKEQNAQWNRLHHGHARAIISKPPKSAAGGKTAKIRFGIRTRTAVMGVRGTDFVVETDPKGESSEVRALDGRVDVAKDEKSLLAGRGFSVGGGQWLQSTLSGVQKPKAFDKDKYLGALRAKQPDVDSLRNQAPRPPQELEKLHEKGQAAASQVKPPEVPKVPPAPKLPDPPKVPEVPKVPGFGR